MNSLDEEKTDEEGNCEDADVVPPADYTQARPRSRRSFAIFFLLV